MRKIKSLAVLSCFFNPVGYKTTVKNWKLFNEQMKLMGLDSYTIELCYDGVSYLPDDKNIYKIHASSENALMWQKERLLNILIEKVAPNYDAVCIMDSDIIIDPEKTNWKEELKQKLEEHTIVQPFSKTLFIGKDSENTVFYKYSAGWAYQNNFNFMNRKVYHPGHGIAFRSDFILEQKLYDLNILGGGDFTLFYLISPEGYLNYNAGTTQDSINMLNNWKNKSVTDLGYVECDVYHLYHGYYLNRKYTTRHEILKDHNFNIYYDIEKCPDTQIWKWSENILENKPELVKDVKNYFLDRMEDD